eukprot:m.46740 g.46740  ORF g.46740 m.46740 type:complete len:520 (-) comp20323_c0_seq1:437-1996(-)
MGGVTTEESSRQASCTEELNCCCSASPPGAGFTICHVPDNDCIPKCLRVFLNVLIAPFYWIWRSIDIFLLGCFRFYLGRFFCFGFRVCSCAPCGCNCYVYKDGKFPATARSLGKFRGKSQQQLQTEMVWKRAWDCFDKPRADEKLPGDCLRRVPAGLFCGKVEPQDINQGEIGDCWLMTALACASEYRGSIHNLFVTKESSHRGKYVVRLYDGYKQTWKRITVDDMIPCHIKSGKPLFAQPHEREMWVLILEKAFAKLLGGYDRLDGGNIVLAFQALTGDPVFHLSKKNGAFERFQLKYYEPKPNDELGRPDVPIGLAKVQNKVYSEDALFHLLQRLVRNKGLIGAGTPGKDQGTSTAKDGLVQGHAYTVLDVREVSNARWNLGNTASKFRLVQLRNPWGKFEWSGKFSDGSEEWKKFKNVAKKIGHKQSDDVDDGIFWMPFSDFYEKFSQIDCCDRSSGFGDLYLGVDEEMGVCGPCGGCLWGCAKYWVLCKGCRASFFGRAGGDPLLSSVGMEESEV